MKIEIERATEPNSDLVGQYKNGNSFPPLKSFELSFDSDSIRVVGEEYVKRAVVINCSGVINPVESEEKARYLAEAHVGWSWGILLQKRAPRPPVWAGV